MNKVETEMLERIAAANQRPGGSREPDELVAARSLAESGGLTWERLSPGGRDRLIGVAGRVLSAVERNRR